MNTLSRLSLLCLLGYGGALAQSSFEPNVNWLTANLCWTVKNNDSRSDKALQALKAKGESCSSVLSKNDQPSSFEPNLNWSTANLCWLATQKNDSRTEIALQLLKTKNESCALAQLQADGVSNLKRSKEEEVKPTLPIPATAIVEHSIDKRLALVIGNADYKTHPLRNAKNDANDVSTALKSSGFQVIDLRDSTLQQMRSGVRQFGDRLINNDVGLVYYSGHGVEVKGRNYFIPVNADIQREDEIADQGLDVSLVLEKMSTAGKGVNILIVDACRDDPFGRSFRSSSRGLANMDAPRGTIIAYATSPGKVASDGEGRNSPYTKHLVRAMQHPNKPIEQVFKEVRRAVQEETQDQQTPWKNTSLSGDFYFKVVR